MTRRTRDLREGAECLAFSRRCFMCVCECVQQRFFFYTPLGRGVFFFPTSSLVAVSVADPATWRLADPVSSSLLQSTTVFFKTLW